MKKTLIAVILSAVLFMGCAGMNASVPVNIATDVAFVMVLQNNPSYKAPVVAALQTVRTYLIGSVTYDDLLLFINKQFGGKYAYVGIILAGYLDTDKPLFETWLPMSETYRAAIIAKIDRLIVLAGM
jgi:hypothetical protein